MMARRRSFGWTLLELLIGLGIFALLAAAVYTALHMGLSTWKRMDLNADRTQELRVVLDRLSTDLRNSFPSRGMKETLWAPFEGRSDQLTFPTLIFFRSPEHHRGNWRLAVVRYVLEDGRLIRRISWNFKKPEGKEIWDEEDVWVEGVAALGFQYAYKSVEGGNLYRWDDQWPIPENETAKPRIPRLIKISLSVGERKLGTVVRVPQGVLGEEGA